MEQPIVKQKTNWRLIGDLAKQNRAHLIFGALCTLLAAVFSFAIPFVTSFTLDYVIAGLPGDVPNAVLAWLDLRGGREFLVNRLYLCGLVLLALTLLNGLFTFLRRRETAFVSEGVSKTMRDRLYRHLEDMPYDYHKHASTGDLVQRCTSDVDTIRRFISMQLMEIVRTLSMVVIAVGVMYAIHPTMALYSTAAMPLLTLSSFVYFNRVQKHFTTSDEAEGKLSAMLQENLTGMRVVRAFGRELDEINRFTAFNADYRDKTFRLSKLLGFYWGFSDMAGYLQIAVSLVAGVLFVCRGEFTLGNVALFATYTSMLTWPVRQLGRILADMGKASVSMKRLDDILSAPVETEPGKALQPDLDGDVVFDHVCFGYDRFDDVLKDVSFTAAPGQTIGILGSTGSGKTSLVQLLQRLYTVTSGSITINGVNINDIEHGHLRKNIGIVLQEPFLYARTIMDNIRIVDPAASPEQVYAAAKAASVHDVITSFDEGYDTVVGERGVTLSGGQQQRVAIARILLKHPRILVFDDSMSAVDAETDAAIRKSLEALHGQGIMFLISHRVTTLQRSDLILVLEHGQIVQRGTHDSLLKEDGLYRRIAEIQEAANSTPIANSGAMTPGVIIANTTGASNGATDPDGHDAAQEDASKIHEAETPRSRTQISHRKGGKRI